MHFIVDIWAQWVCVMGAFHWISLEPASSPSISSSSVSDECALVGSTILSRKFSVELRFGLSFNARTAFSACSLLSKSTNARPSGLRETLWAPKQKDYSIRIRIGNQFTYITDSIAPYAENKEITSAWVTFFPTFVTRIRFKECGSAIISSIIWFDLYRTRNNHKWWNYFATHLLIFDVIILNKTFIQ